MCNDVLKAGSFKLSERFTYLSDATGIEEPSYMQKYAEVLDSMKNLFSCALCYSRSYVCLRNSKYLQNPAAVPETILYFFPSQFYDSLHKHNWISLHQVVINSENNTLKKIT